jgi:hypothetical protein
MGKGKRGGGRPEEKEGGGRRRAEGTLNEGSLVHGLKGMDALVNSYVNI